MCCAHRLPNIDETHDKIIDIGQNGLCTVCAGDIAQRKKRKYDDDVPEDVSDHSAAEQWARRVWETRKLCVFWHCMDFENLTDEILLEKYENCHRYHTYEDSHKETVYVPNEKTTSYPYIVHFEHKIEFEPFYDTTENNDDLLDMDYDSLLPRSSTRACFALTSPAFRQLIFAPIEITIEPQSKYASMSTLQFSKRSLSVDEVYTVRTTQRSVNNCFGYEYVLGLEVYARSVRIEFGQFIEHIRMTYECPKSR